MARTGAATARLRVAASGQTNAATWRRRLRDRRLLAEIAFALLAVLTIALMATDTLLRLLDARKEHVALSLEQMDMTASLIAERLGQRAPEELSDADLGAAQRMLTAILPLSAQANATVIGLTDRSGRVVASLGLNRAVTSLADLVGDRNLAAARAGTLRAKTPEGVDSIIAVRDLRRPFGQIALIAPTSRYLARWREHARSLTRLAGVVAAILFLLAAALLWQRRRTHAALREGKKALAKMRAAMADTWRTEGEMAEKDEALATIRTDLARSRLAMTRQAAELATLDDRCQHERLRAEDANRAKSAFLANMNHELRTPLNAIIGFSEIMESGLFGALGSAKYGEYVSNIRRSGQYLLGVFSDILEMACIEAGKCSLERRSVPLKDVVGEAAVSVAGAAEAKNLELVIDAPVADDIDVDPAALVKVLVHLARNAINHTPAGGRVRISAKLYPSHIGIHVGDTGSGIPKHRLADLGQPFQRVNTDVMKTCPGSGLGLAIARSIVELHGGRLRIRSREGRGTVVALDLPLRRAA